MPLVDGSLLRVRGMPDALIKEYVEATEDAWSEIESLEIAAGRGPTVSLHLKESADPQTVVARLGTAGRFGAVEATSPAGLRIVLVQHLLEKLAPNRTDPSVPR